MVKLVLAGGGDKEESRPVDEFFVDLLPKEKELLYIPIAMPESKYTYSECYEFIESVFNPLGLRNITMWVDSDFEGVQYEDLKAFDAVYIGGGNTYSLLYKFRKTGFIDPLRSFILDGKPVYGGSAGAILLGKNIDTSQVGKYHDKNKFEVKKTMGLNLIGGYSIHCHYAEKYDKEIFRYVHENKEEVISIPEVSGVYYNGKKIKVLGRESVRIFRKGKKIEKEPGTTFGLR